MKYAEATRRMHFGVKVRRPKWAKGSYLFAQQNENAKTGAKSFATMIVAHEDNTELRGAPATLLRPPTPWVASPDDLEANDWKEYTDDDGAGCIQMPSEGRGEG